MDEPLRVEKAVPPTTVTYDSLPGTRPIRWSIALNIRIPSPVLKNSSPMSRNSGIGTSPNEDSAPKPLFRTWVSPELPPIKYQAPTRLAPINANATGAPRIMRTSTIERRKNKASYQAILLISFRAAMEQISGEYEPDKLNPHQRKTDRIRSEEHTSELQSRPHLVCRLLLEK